MLYLVDKFQTFKNIDAFLFNSTILMQIRQIVDLMACQWTTFCKKVYFDVKSEPH